MLKKLLLIVPFWKVNDEVQNTYFLLIISKASLNRNQPLKLLCQILRETNSETAILFGIIGDFLSGIIGNKSEGLREPGLDSPLRWLLGEPEAHCLSIIKATYIWMNKYTETLLKFWTRVCQKVT